MNHFSRDQRDYGRFRESDSYEDSDDHDFETDGTFTKSNFRFDDEYYGRENRGRRPMGRFSGINRFGERRIRHDAYQDDQYRNHYDPTYEDVTGRRHPYEHGGRNRWSDDIRSESSRESHFGKGPRGYKRSSERIKDEACEILARDFELDASDIEVDVKDEVITLSGEVSSRRDKRIAEILVENISGVHDVHNQLRIKRSDVEGWIPGIGSVEDEI